MHLVSSVSAIWLVEKVFCTSQEIGWEDLRNNSKPYSTQLSSWCYDIAYALFLW